MASNQQPALFDSNQNFWQLTCIQSAAQSLPGMFLGAHLAKIYGNGIALLSIILGNVLLWIIALAIIAMTGRGRNNAIENVTTYLGKPSAILTSVILISAFMAWYVVNIQATTTTMDQFFANIPEWENNLKIRVGVALGLITALLATGGIQLIKRFNTSIFPFLLAFLLLIMIIFGKIPAFIGTWGLSLPAVIIAFGYTLPGFVNLPTFFRHSRSMADSLLALSLITVFDIVFEISTIFIDVGDYANFFAKPNFAFGNAYVLLAIAFVTLSFLCINLVNVYFASAGWEAIVPRVTGSKEYAIIGLIGTSTYTFIQTKEPMIFIQNLMESLIAALGAVLILSFIVQLVVRHRPRRLEKFTSSTCWLAGIITSIIYQVRDPINPSAALLAGIVASVFTFLVVIFVEESFWSGQNLSKPRKSN